MQTQDLSQLKQQIVLLDPDSKKHLAEFLAHELDSEPPESRVGHSDNDRVAQIEWLKANRDQYANKYVALAGKNLVAEGETFAETMDLAREGGFPDAFVTYVFAEDEQPFGGW